jgi:hypothetical protein
VLANGTILRTKNDSKLCDQIVQWIHRKEVCMTAVSRIVESVENAEAAIDQSLIRVLDLWNELGASDDILAQAVAVPATTLKRWRKGTYPQTATRRRLAELGGLYRQLLESFGDPTSAGNWLCRESTYLGGLKPVDALRAQRLDRVRAALTALDAGFAV